MPKNPLEAVEIVEPPIGELTKKNASLTKTCLTGCGCIVLFLLGVILALRLIIGSGPTKLKTVPANFPAGIPVYDTDTIERITYIPGKYKSRSTEISALLPKILLSPLLSDQTSTTASTGFSVRGIWKLLITPVGDTRDTVQIEWKNIDAEPRFIVSYYRKELTKGRFQVDKEKEENGSLNLSFTRDAVSGSLVATGSGKKRTTDYALLTVHYYPNGATSTP